MPALPSPSLPPAFLLSADAPSGVVGADVVAVPVLAAPEDGSEGVALGPGAAELIDELGVDLFDVLQDARGRAGDVAVYPVLETEGLTNPELRRVLLVGVGAGSAPELRRAGAALARRTTGARSVATSLAALSDDAGLRALVEGLVLGSFTFHRRSEAGQDGIEPPARQFVLAGLGDAGSRRPALDRSVAVAEAGWTSRVLALTPSNEKTPAWLADRARAVASEAGLTVKVWDEKALEREGFGGLIGVGKASVNPPRLVRLDYTPRRAGRRTPHVVLVGKGITFDTGGLSIKPRDAMMNMKRDMTGAGVVLSVMAALSSVDCPVKVTGLLACAENSIAGNAIRPGDVIRHYGGRTSEVTNTDAEGRLVLADAMAYAVSELKPTVLVDIATLTGAMKISLGQGIGGMFVNDDGLAGLLSAAGEAAGEPLWRMPLAEDYEERLASKIADADNAAGGPGAITAALFLQHFAGELPWAHLDIASVGDSPIDRHEYTKGATGFGARALLHWLELRDPLADVHIR